MNFMEFSLVFPTIATPTSHGTTTGPANYNWEGLKDTILGDTDPGDCFCQISPSVQQILAMYNPYGTHVAPKNLDQKKNSRTDAAQHHGCIAGDRKEDPSVETGHFYLVGSDGTWDFTGSGGVHSE